MAMTGFSGLSWVMKTIFIASLAFNLLVIGAVATAWHLHGGKHWRHGSVERSLMHFAYRELPRDKRRALRKSWRAERKAMKPLFKDVRAARKDLARVLQAESYDRAGLETALEGVWQKRAAVRQRAASIAARSSFVVVLPAEPVTPTSRSGT